MRVNGFMHLRLLRIFMACCIALAASHVPAAVVGWNEESINAHVPLLLEMAHRSDAVAHVYVSEILSPPGVTTLGDAEWFAKCSVKETLKGIKLPPNIQINFVFPAKGPTPPIATNREFIVFLLGRANSAMFTPVDQQLSILACNSGLLDLAKASIVEVEKKNAKVTAQPIASLSNPNMPASVKGVQLSINLTNNVITADSETIINVEITNASLKVIRMVETDPLKDFNVVLISNQALPLKGEATYLTYQLTSDTSAHGYAKTLLEIGPGERRDWRIPVIISAGIQPGEYTLQATRRFRSSGGDYELKSNFLKVQVQ
jgi:hypothetical protein